MTANPIWAMADQAVHTSPCGRLRQRAQEGEQLGRDHILSRHKSQAKRAIASSLARRTPSESSEPFSRIRKKGVSSHHSHAPLVHNSTEVLIMPRRHVTYASYSCGPNEKFHTEADQEVTLQTHLHFF